MLGIPVVVHEQNAIPGFTNTLSAKFANMRLEAFEGAFATKSVANAEYVGNPVRDEIVAKASDYKTNTPFNILIVGGSLGAVALNELLPKVLKAVSEQGVLINVQHQCGKGRSEEVSTYYQSVGFDCQVSDFIEDMAAAYQWADLVVCRSGAMTVAELAVAGRAAIFVPFPYAVDDHQTANANWLAERGGALVFQQKELSEKRLTNTLLELFSAPEKINAMAAAAKSAAKVDATQNVAERILEVARG